MMFMMFMMFIIRLRRRGLLQVNQPAFKQNTGLDTNQSAIPDTPEFGWDQLFRYSNF